MNNTIDGDTGGSDGECEMVASGCHCTAAFGACYKDSVCGIFSNRSISSCRACGLHGACQAAFGNRARMCLADEVIRAPEIVRFTQDLQAWVQPGASHFPCAGWTSSVGSGTVLDARTMSFVNKPCGTMLPVTCCQEEAVVSR